MSRRPRLLVDDLETDEVTLGKAARHHLTRVLRARAGQALDLLDGRGGAARAVWTGSAVEVVQRHPREPAPADGVEVALAPPRPSRLDWAVEKLAELGVTRVTPLITARAVREPGALRRDRLQRKADEALQQCGALHRLEIGPPAPLEALLERATADATLELWVATPPAPIVAGEEAPGPDATPTSTPTPPGPAPPAWPQRRPGHRLCLVVGPEGGFTEGEQAALRGAQAREVTLGRTVLRVETAALVLGALAIAAAPRLG